MSDSPLQAGREPPPAAAPVLEYAPDDHRALRGKRIKLALISAALTRPLSLVVTLVTVPIFLGMLGHARFGLLETVGALALWVGLSNGGMGLALFLRLMDANVSGDRLLAQRYVSTLFVAMCALLVGGTAILSCIVPAIDWGSVFDIADPAVAREVAWGVWAAGLLTLGGLACGVPAVIYSAHQENHRNNLWEGATRLVTLAACFGIAFFPWAGLVGALVALNGGPVLVRTINWLWLARHEKPWLRPRVSQFEWGLLRTLLSEGVLLFILQTATVAIYQTDKIIIGVLLGPEEVAPYSVLAKYFVSGYAVFWMFLTPLWAAHGDAVRRGDLAWVRRGVRLSSILGCGGVLLAGGVILLWGDWIIPLWTRDPSLHSSRGLMLAMTIGFALRAWIDSRSVVLLSAGKLMPQIWFFVAYAALNLVLAIVLGKWLGVAGVAWAIVISATATTLWGYPWMMHRYIYRPGAVVPGEGAADGSGHSGDTGDSGGRGDGGGQAGASRMLS